MVKKKYFGGIPQKKLKFRILSQKINLPLFTPFPIPRNPKKFHGIPHLESAFDPHPIKSFV
jgi:hypothetical protein